MVFFGHRRNPGSYACYPAASCHWHPPVAQEMRTPTASADCRLLAAPALAGPAASLPVSASSYGFPEDIGVVAVVVPELELGHVKRQVLGRHLVERAHNPAFQQRPEAVDRASMDGTGNVFAPAVADELVVELPIEVPVA